MKSAMKHSDVIQDYLAKECLEGRIVDPLPLDSFPQVQISRFGVIPKSSPDKWCLFWICHHSKVLVLMMASTLTGAHYHM